MFVILFFITLFFLITAFLPNTTPIITTNPIFGFLVYEISLSLKASGYFVLGFLIISLILFRINFDRKRGFGGQYFSAFSQSLLAVGLSFFIAYILLYFIAFIQLNIFSLLVNTNPKAAGLENNIAVISKNLQERNFAPQVIITNNDQGEILSALAAVPSGTNNYYGRYIVRSIPHFFVIPIKTPDGSILLMDNTVIVTKLQKENLQKISQYLAYDLVKSYFPTKKIKTDAEVTILGQEQYAQHRQEDAVSKLNKVAAEIEKITGKVSSLSATIVTNENNILESTTLVKQQKTDSLNDYRKCMLDRTPQDLCKQLQETWNTKMQEEKEKQEAWSKQIVEDKKLLEAYAFYDEFFKAQRQNLEVASERLPNENGVFLPKNTIRIVLTGENTDALTAFFESLVHEYLHFTSYVADTKKFDSTFFEEGLTEYFARKIVLASFAKETNYGYPVQVKIITAMTNMITEDEFATYYFTKDQEGLERALNRVYGDGFYKNNYIAFETLQYISEPKEVLKIANGIMKKIGGEQLTEEDLYSTNAVLK